MLTADYDRLGLQPGASILDLGCGFGRHAYEAARRGARVTAVDYAADEVEGVLGTFALMIDAGELPASTDIAVLRGDALALPFATGTFDHVICSEVLEHIPDDVAAMAELARVLKPGGTMAVTIPRFLPELINWTLSDAYHNVPGGHVRIYRRAQVTARLRSVGLRVSGHGYAHGLHSPYWWLKCLVGTTNNDNFFVRQYLKFLTWDIVKAPTFSRTLDTILNPLIGKSFVLYLEKPVAP
jgi:SAM-dependent methyltransferase